MKRLKIYVIVGLLVAGNTGNAATIEMTVNGLVCAFCAQGIEKKLKKYPATAEVVVNLEHRLVAVSLKEGQNISDEELRRSLTDAGYTVKAIARSDKPMAEIRESLKQAKP